MASDSSGGQVITGGVTVIAEVSGGETSRAAGGNSGGVAAGGVGVTGGRGSGGATSPLDASGGEEAASGGSDSAGGAAASGGSETAGGAAASGGSDSAGGVRSSGLTQLSSAGATLTGGSGNNGGGQTGTSHDAAVFVIQPRLEPNKNDSAPLAAMLTLETNVSTSGTVQLSGGGESWSVRLDNASVHNKALLGFKPDTDYRVTVTVAAGNTELSAPPLTWHTPALPNDFPHLVFVKSDPARMASGMTMFDVIHELYVVVVDGVGQVRWYYKSPMVNHRYRQLANGNIICVSGGSHLTEIDWFGNVVNTWYAADSGTPPSGAIPVAVNNFHHNVEEMPNGNLVVLSQEGRFINNYPISSDDPTAGAARAWVIGDQIVEMTRSGEIAKRYSLFDILDPARIGHDGETKDWTHSNAIIYDPGSDAYLVSMRHQDAVIKVRRDTGELIWILGNHANWRAPWLSKLLTPLGDEFAWQYHQHAIELTPHGIGLYDNGNYRAPAYQEPNPPYYSRAVRFAIDEEAMTVEQLWVYQPRAGTASIFSSGMSDADLLPNGNVLIDSGGVASPRNTSGWSQIIEVTDSGESVFELDVLDSPRELTTFDADRIADIRHMTSDGS